MKIIKKIIQAIKFNAYKSIDTLPVWNFYQIIESNNLKYLIKSDEYDFELLLVLTKDWEKLYNDYTEISSGNKMSVKKLRLKQVCELRKKITLFQTLESLIYANPNEQKYKEWCKEIGLEWDENKGLKKLTNHIRGLYTMILIKSKGLEQENKKVNIDIYEICTGISEILYNGNPIDPKKISVKEFVSLCNQMKVKADRQNAEAEKLKTKRR